MGIFDSVYVPCPECGHENEFQTKGMPFPYMNRLPADAVPLAAAVYIISGDDDIIPDAPYPILCDGCDMRLELKWEPEIPSTVAFTLVIQERGV